MLGTPALVAVFFSSMTEPMKVLPVSSNSSVMVAEAMRDWGAPEGAFLRRQLEEKNGRSGAGQDLSHASERHNGGEGGLTTWRD